MTNNPSNRNSSKRKSIKIKNFIFFNNVNFTAAYVTHTLKIPGFKLKITRRKIPSTVFKNNLQKKINNYYFLSFFFFLIVS
jgi:hypothetical protein